MSYGRAVRRLELNLAAALENLKSAFLIGQSSRQ